MNMVVLMVETDDQSLEKEIVMFWIQFIFVIIFLIEFILKIMALRQHYFRNVLNIVDFVVLVMGIAGESHTEKSSILTDSLFSVWFNSYCKHLRAVTGTTMFPVFILNVFLVSQCQIKSNNSFLQFIMGVQSYCRIMITKQM